MRTPQAWAGWGLCLFLLGAGGAGALAAEPAAYSDTAMAFRKAMRSPNPSEWMQAAELLAAQTDARALSLVLDGMDRLDSHWVDVERDQEAAQAEYAKIFDEIEGLKKRWEGSSKTGKDVEAYNKRAQKLTAKLDHAKAALNSLENRYTRNDALMQRLTAIAGDILGRLEGEDLERGLGILEEGLLQSPDVTRRVRWVYAVWGIQQAPVRSRLHGLAGDPAVDREVRVTALLALAARADPEVAQRCTGLLQAPAEDFDLVAAAIQGLRTLHQKDAIEHLITFLRREDIGRLREDAHQALMSLTGQEHGPYFDPWNRWWEESGDTFQMPANPREAGILMGEADPDASAFYGITTFSTRILFVLDISGSMLEPATGDPNHSKMDVARRELIGAVMRLDTGSTFNVVFFNHEVVRWQLKPQTADPRTKAQLKKWVEETVPLGGTNLHDALDMGFELATAGEGPLVFDTIYFMTDGRPTAGKLWAPEAILAQVRSWNRTARLKIHAIGVGKEHDAAFLQELARIGDGQYVSR